MSPNAVKWFMFITRELLYIGPQSFVYVKLIRRPLSFPHVSLRVSGCIPQRLPLENRGGGGAQYSLVSHNKNSKKKATTEQRIILL